MTPDTMRGECSVCGTVGNVADSGKCADVSQCDRNRQARFPGKVDAVQEKPIVVCLCGSTKFAEAFARAAYDEGMAGRIVLSVCFFAHRPDTTPAGMKPFTLTPEQKTRVDELHLRKIDLADEILVLNVGGYLGDSTKRELEYAISQGKRVRFLEPTTNEIDVQGMVNKKGVKFIGKAKRHENGTWTCLADVGGALCVVEVRITVERKELF